MKTIFHRRDAETQRGRNGRGTRSSILNPHSSILNFFAALRLCASAVYLLLALSASAGTGAWIYGTNVFADATGSGGVEIHFQPLSNRVVLPNGALMRTYPVTIITSNSGSIGSNYLVSGPYRVSTPETRDTFTINVPSDDAAYDWVTLATNTFSFINYAPGGFIAVNSGGGSSNLLTAPRLAKNALVPTNSIGQVWTATGTNGAGAWSNAPAGGAADLYSNNVQVAAAATAIGTTNDGTIQFTWRMFSSRPTLAADLAVGVTNDVTTNLVGRITIATNDVTTNLVGRITIATNDVTTNVIGQLNSASNILYGLIVGGGVSAGVATNIAQYFATNSAIITSNALLAILVANDTTTSNALRNLIIANDTTTSNGAVAFTMAASNNLAALFIGYDTITSNGVVAFTMAASNNLAALLVANDTVTSNALRTLLIANDTTTSNGVVSFGMTLSNNVASLLAANDITTSNGVVSFGMTLSNNLAILLSANDIITSNGVVAFTMTASNNLASLIVANDNVTSNALYGLIGAATYGVSTNFEYFLSSGVATGITAVVLDRAPVFRPSTVGGVTRGPTMLAIGLGDTNCELRRVATISGTTINLNGGGFQFAHAAGERILWFSGDAHFAWWGTKGDGTEENWKIYNAIHDANQLGIWLDGAQATYGHTVGLVGLHDGRLKTMNFTAVSTYLGNGTNDALFQVAQGERYFFTADAGTDTITIGAGWNPPAGRPTDPTNTCVIFQGTNLPGGIVMGKIYYVKGGTATTMQIGVDTNSSSLDITSAGAGNNFVWTEVRSMSRYFLDDVTLTGNNLASNGLWSVLQQPTRISKLRVNSVVGFGIKTDESQDGVFDNTMLINCLHPLDDRDSVNLQFDVMNMEHFAGQWFLGSQHNSYNKVHIETGNEYSGGSIINATSTVPVNVSINNLYVTQSSAKDVVFEGGNANQAWCGAIRNFYSSSSFDSDQLMIKDVRRGRRVYGFKTGVPFSASQYILEELAPCPPSSESYSDEGGGWNVVGLDGALFHIGGQHYNADFAFVQAGTNHTGSQFVFRDSSGAPGLVVSNGTPIVSNALQYAVGSPASGKILTVSSDGRTVFPSNAPTVTGFDTLTVTNQANVGNIGPWINAASFDAVSDYANRTADLSGNMDTNRITGEFWFKSAATNVERSIFGSASANQHFSIALDNNDLLQIQGWSNSPSGLTLKMTSSSAYGDLLWHHAVFSFNLDPTASAAHLYVDGTNALSATITTNGCMIDMTADDWTVGTRGDSFTKWNGCLADCILWAGTNATYIDLSQAANRLKFYNAGSAVDPGQYGTFPTGTRPLLYLREWTGVNAGYGGNFTINGTLSDACSPPPYPITMLTVRLSTNTATGIVVKDTNSTPVFAVDRTGVISTNVTTTNLNAATVIAPTVSAINLTWSNGIGTNAVLSRTVSASNLIASNAQFSGQITASNITASNAVFTGSLNASNAIFTNASVAMAGSGSNAWVGGPVWYNAGNQTNLNAAAQLTNFAQVTVPAMTLTNPGARLKMEWNCKPSDAGANTNQFVVWFGTNLYDSGLIISNQTAVKITAEIECQETNVQHYFISVFTRPFGTVAGAIFTNTFDGVLAGNAFIANTFSLQAACRRLGGITNTSARLSYEPGPPR